MSLDLVAIGLVVLFALVGGLTGAWAQVVRIVALVGAWWTGRFLGLRYGPLLAKEAGLPPLAGVVLLAMALGFLLFVIVTVVGRWILRKLREGKGPGPADRAAGVLLGAVKSGLAVWLVVSVLVVFEKPVAGLGWKVDTRRSEVATLARRYNLVALAGLPLGRIRASLARRDVARDPQLRRLARDRGLQRALADGDALEVLRRGDVLNALADPKLRAKLLGAALPAEAPPRAEARSPEASAPVAREPEAGSSRAPAAPAPAD